jgi:hypothetical protein
MRDWIQHNQVQLRVGLPDSFVVAIFFVPGGFRLLPVGYTEALAPQCQALAAPRSASWTLPPVCG